MSKIAQGINVYYDNDKNKPNIVFLSDETVRYYPDGGMLFEFIDDEVVYMMTEKLQNRVRLYPNYNDPLSVENITECFSKWLYYTLDEEDKPVATELFRSSFSESIHRILENENAMQECSTVGEFMSACCDDFLSYLQAFALFFDALAADASGEADVFQKDIADIFKSSADDLYETYKKKCSVRHKNRRTQVETHNITNPIQLLDFEYSRLKKHNKSVKICQNCGRYFIPPKRNDTVFCQMPSPQNEKKTCQEIGPQIRRNEKRKNNPDELEHHRKMSSIRMGILRAKNSGEDQLLPGLRKMLENEKKRYSSAIDYNSNR